VWAEAGVWRSAPSNTTDPLSFTVQAKERVRAQFASLKTEAAMLGKWAAILDDSGWGSRVVLKAKKLGTAGGRGGGAFIIISPDATATDDANAGGFACRFFLPWVEGATA